MNVFELWGSLGLDSSKFSEGLSLALGEVTNFKTGALKAFDAVKKADKFLDDVANAAAGGALKLISTTVDIATAVDKNIVGAYDEAAAVVETALSTMASATADFIKASFQEGLGFDSAMGQVQATLLKTREDLDTETVRVDGFTGTLREFAKEMGRTTKFTALESGQALNYMALAGMNAQESAEMLPKVLNLAAAGAMDLGRASDIVTDAQTALGISLEETGVLIDQMAKTASSSNTSVEQLGDAILAIGATGRMIRGGYTELNTALGILADNGEKASEAGNDLRRILVRLTANTDAAAAMEELGFSAYDAEDKLKPLPDIFTELNEKMAGLTDGQRNAAVTTIFGQYALAGANALLNTSAERWEELTEKITDSDEAAKKMAGIQNATLPGMITLMESAASALKTEVYEKIAPLAGTLVEQFTDGLSNAAEAIKQGDVQGAFEAVGDTIGTAIKTGVEIFTENSDNIVNFSKTFGEFIEEIAQTLIDTAFQTEGTFLGVASAVGTNLISSIANVLGDEDNVKKISTGISFFFDSVSDFFEKNEEDLQTIFSTIFDFAVQILSGVFTTKREIAYTLVTNKIEDLIDKLPEIISTILEGKDLQKAIDATFNFIERIMQKLIDNSDEIVPTVLNFLSNLAGKALESIAKIFDSPSNVEKITNAINDVLDSILGFYYENEDEINTIIDGIVDIAIKIIPKVWAIKKVAGFKIVGEIVKELFDELTLKIVDFTSEEKSEERINSLKEMGKSLIGGMAKGLWEGVTNMIPELGLISTFVISAMKTAFGISSPSKLMRDKVGVYLAQGIGEGFSDEMKNVMRDINDEIPTDFDISSDVVRDASARNAGQNIIINIDTVNGTTREDAYKFAETVSRALSGQIYREKVAII